MSNVPETKVDPSLSTPEVPDQALHNRLDKMRADSAILGSMNKILGEYKRFEVLANWPEHIMARQLLPKVWGWGARRIGKS